MTSEEQVARLDMALRRSGRSGEMTVKLKPMGWGERGKNERLANLLWPHLAPAENQSHMLRLANQDQRAGELQKRIKEGSAKYQTKRRSTW